MQEILDAFAELCNMTINYVTSVHLHGSTQLPFNILSWNFVLKAVT